ncbi:MAG: DUF4870 domain-containing protein [Melioribacteraceae bacterium]|nr:DUF4870 domain-containing protein [Melioribacteraceae bacterium]RJP62812.1 MAG: DUF4870 domain-containing protein [Ignavibacteriales bacterium]WKZ68661.1 MAG: DUF4870 domain-containing protein [Melioribacteraceae bacterium]
METSISKDERMWGMFCHISAFAFFIFPFGNIIGPLVVWLIKKDVYPFVDEQGKESLNFQISVSIYAFAALLLSIILIGIPILIALFFFDFILVVVAAVKANDGFNYKYPLSIQLIK